MSNEWEKCLTYFAQVLAQSREYDLRQWGGFAVAFQSVAQAQLSPTPATLARLKRTIDFSQANSTLLYLPIFQTSYAEICGKLGLYDEGLDNIAQAHALVVQTGERQWEAETWRVKGELIIQAKHDPIGAEAEDCFQTAIQIARQQEAKSLELRATISLAEHWRSQGREAEAHATLSQIYHWFTEGFATKDLLTAKSLLDELKAQMNHPPS